MRTERDQILVDKKEIIEYINNIDNFHDYLIGGISYDGKSFCISIEEDYKKTDPSNAPALIWDFIFEDLEMFKFSCDCIVGFWIQEVVFEEGDFVFYNTSGCFEVRSKNVRLETPKKITE